VAGREQPCLGRDVLEDLVNSDPNDLSVDRANEIEQIRMWAFEQVSSGYLLSDRLLLASKIVDFVMQGALLEDDDQPVSGT
jgi:hypothetical protein